MPQKRHRNRSGRVGHGDENPRRTVITKEQSSKKPNRKKGSERSQRRGQKEEENTVKEIFPDELWGNTVSFLLGSCDVKKWSNLLAVLTRHSGSRSARDKDKQGTNWDQNLSPRFKVRKPLGAAEKWLRPLQASQRGGFLLTSEKPTEITRTCSWRPLCQWKRNLKSLAAKFPCGL